MKPSIHYRATDHGLCGSLPVIPPRAKLMKIRFAKEIEFLYTKKEINNLKCVCASVSTGRKWE
jgi:hypothetical protein